ncbi:MAG: non-homologous end-joining DNA ligase [Acidimicrobiales bacterium]
MSSQFAAMPANLAPMLATAATQLPTGAEAWAFEVKWDGVRALAFVEGGRVRLQNRNGVNITGRYAEVAGDALGLRQRQLLLDGEVVAFDTQGRPSFNALARHSGDVRYVVFDLLHLDGTPLLETSYLERRALLAGLGLGGPETGGPAWQVPAYHLGDGAELYEATRTEGLEGLVAKRLDSRYLPGKRSALWLKLKHRHQSEFVVGGWLRGSGRRATTLGALLVGYHSGNDLCFAGRVGTGFNDTELARLTSALATLHRDDQPFGPSPAAQVPRLAARGAQWVNPMLVVEVSFAEWTAEARLRHPSYLGTRDDVDPAQVRSGR